MRGSVFHFSFDGVTLDEAVLEKITVTRELVVAEGSVSTQPLRSFVESMLQNHSHGDVVQFESEDKKGRELSGVGTIREIDLKTEGELLRFRVIMTPGVE